MTLAEGKASNSKFAHKGYVYEKINGIWRKSTETYVYESLEGDLKVSKPFKRIERIIKQPVFTDKVYLLGDSNNSLLSSDGGSLAPGAKQESVSLYRIMREKMGDNFTAYGQGGRSVHSFLGSTEESFIWKRLTNDVGRYAISLGTNDNNLHHTDTAEPYYLTASYFFTLGLYIALNLKYEDFHPGEENYTTTGTWSSYRGGNLGTSGSSYLWGFEYSSSTVGSTITAHNITGRYVAVPFLVPAVGSQATFYGKGTIKIGDLPQRNFNVLRNMYKDTAYSPNANHCLYVIDTESSGSKDVLTALDETNNDNFYYIRPFGFDSTDFKCPLDFVLPYINPAYLSNGTLSGDAERILHTREGIREAVKWLNMYGADARIIESTSFGMELSDDYHGDDDWALSAWRELQKPYEVIKYNSSYSKSDIIEGDTEYILD